MILTRIPFLFIITFVISSSAQNISSSINDFSVNLLGSTNSEAGDKINIALSPFTIWSLLTIISEGATGNTLLQLKNVLKLDPNVKKLRDEYAGLHTNLLKDSDGVQLQFSSAIFTNMLYKLREQFEKTAREFYNVEVRPIDFRNTKGAVTEINKYIARNTNFRINSLVNQDDVTDAYIFLTSVLYFKGQWNVPFNRSATKADSFFDEKSNKIGDVQMMYQAGFFPYSRIESIRAYALELPYGADQKMSMVVILPFKTNSISNTLNLLSKFTFNGVLDRLDTAHTQFEDEEVQVYLPRFKIESEFIMDRVLNSMGIKDVFNPQQAELLGILDQYLYITKVLQRAEIQVDEEGSIASAAAGASIAYKSPPPRFYANRPFLYFIVDKPSKSIVFAGKLSNPNNI